MFHITCTLPNASHSINGVAFKPHELGSIITVDPVDVTVASKFKGIPGYSIVDAAPVEKPVPAERKSRKPKEAAATPPAEEVDGADEPEPGAEDGGGDKAA